MESKKIINIFLTLIHIQRNFWVNEFGNAFQFFGVFFIIFFNIVIFIKYFIIVCSYELHV